MNNEFTLQNLKWNAVQEKYAKRGLGTEFFKNWQLMNRKERKFRVTWNGKYFTIRKCLHFKIHARNYRYNIYKI